MKPLPTYETNTLFETSFEPWLTLPGFFPGTGGFFHGYPTRRKRFMFFGTDFGPLKYQRGLGSAGGEQATVKTIANLRGIVDEAGIERDECFLTNAVLCMRQGDSAMSDFPVWKRFPEYVAACARWHLDFIAEARPDVIVLMGVPHLKFGPILFPELAARWRGLKSLAEAFNANKEAPRLSNGTQILLMHHPSMWNSHPKPFKARIVQHLSDVN